MKVKSLKEDFKNAYGSTLRVYNGRAFADDDATLASIRKGDSKGGDFEVSGNMHVSTFEERVFEKFGIKVQVATPDDSSLAKNDISLSASGK
ncbi:hypothetical protein [Flagellimonas marinaquae]